MGGLLTISYPLQALIATIMTWLVTLLGASTVFFTRKEHTHTMDAMLGFGAGVMLASSFWSLLSPGIALAETLQQTGWLVAGTGFLCGGLMLLLGDAIAARLLPAPISQAHRRSWLLVTSITLHNIPEGLAIGVAFGALTLHASDAALTGAWMLAVGIALQNFPEGAAVSLPLRRDGMSRGQAFWYGQLSALVEPLAGLTGALLAVHVQAVLPFLLCFAAGAMIAVVAAELIPECQRNPHRCWMTFATLLGFVIMMTLDVALA